MKMLCSLLTQRKAVLWLAGDLFVLYGLLVFVT